MNFPNVPDKLVLIWDESTFKRETSLVEITAALAKLVYSKAASFFLLANN
jgi:hypothetical protein